MYILQYLGHALILVCLAISVLADKKLVLDMSRLFWSHVSRTGGRILVDIKGEFSWTK